MTEVHPIEAESYRIMRSRIDLSALPPLTRAVTERIIHATADFDYVTDLVCDEMALAAGVEALRRDAPVIADVAMVASGITGYPVICRIGDSLSARLARTANITLSAAAVRLAHGEAGPGAIWLVGCAPTALTELMSRQVEPALVIGVPVGFVGAAAVKAPAVDFTAGGKYADVFSNFKTFSTLSSVIEDTGVAAFKGQVPNLAGTPVLQTALQIHSVEARHAGSVRVLVGKPGSDGAFDKPMSKSEVLEVVKPFFV